MPAKTAIAVPPALASAIALAVRSAKPAATKRTAAPIATNATEILVSVAGLIVDIALARRANTATKAATAATIPKNVAIAAPPALANWIALNASKANAAAISRTAAPINTNAFALAISPALEVLAAVPALCTPFPNFGSAEITLEPTAAPILPNAPPTTFRIGATLESAVSPAKAATNFGNAFTTAAICSACSFNHSANCLTFSAAVLQAISNETIERAEPSNFVLVPKSASAIALNASFSAVPTPLTDLKPRTAALTYSFIFSKAFVSFSSPFVPLCVKNLNAGFKPSESAICAPSKADLKSVTSPSRLSNCVSAIF